MSTSCYRPTPLERAHATHLLITYFNTPVDLHNDDGEIRVSGRDAVPFLLSSGVDRSLLRLIWSVADPEGVGTLLSRSQFHTILRLIAMSQAHFLPPQTPGMETQHAALLKESMMNNSHLVMALPTFSQDNPPTVAHLLGTYPTPASHGMSMGDTSAVESSNVDVSNMLVNHDFQYQMWQKQQQQHASSGIGGESTTPIHLSVDDAFGDMPEVQDLPLPSLQYSNPEDQVDDHVVSDGEVSNDEDFGEFDAVQNEDLPVNANRESPDDGFGNFEGQTSSFEDIGYKTAETLSNGAITSGPMEETVSEDKFYGFDNAKSALCTENDQDDFGGFEGAVGELNFPNQEEEPSGFGNNIDIVQSDFRANNMVADLEKSNHVPTLSITDAFERLVAEREGTTSELGVAVLEGDFHDFAQELADTNNTENDCDNFGESENTTNHTPSQVNDSNGSNRSGSTDFQSESEKCHSQLSSHGPALSISEAFEGLVSDQDECGGFSSTCEQALEANEMELNQKHMSEEDDDLSGFHSPDFTEAYVANRGANGIHPQNTEESLGSIMIRHNNHNHEPKPDDFCSMAANQEMSPVDTNELHANGENDHDFGGFESNVNQMLTAEQQIVSGHATANAQALSISDDFDSMIPEHDSSDPRATDAVDRECSFEPDDNVGSDVVEDDAATENSNIDMPTRATIESTNTIGGQLQSGGLSLLDDVFGVIQDAPLPPLESFSPKGVKSEPTGETEFNESFGGFEEHLVAEEYGAEETAAGFPEAQESLPKIETVGPEAPNDFSDAFGDFAGTDVEPRIPDIPNESEDVNFGDRQDTPLPPLQSFSPKGVEPEPTGEIEFNESFGDFEKSVVAEEYGAEETAAGFPEAQEPLQTIESIGPEAPNGFDDVFGDRQDAPLPPFDSFSSKGVEPEPTGEIEFNESFGEFEGNVVAEEYGAEETAPEGGFAGFPDAQEPLQTIETVGPEASDGFDDDFGDFAGTDVAPSTDGVNDHARAETFEEDGLGEISTFGSATRTSEKVSDDDCMQPTSAGELQADDDFGDFATFDDPKIEGVENTASPTVAEEDDFGDFAEFDSAPPTDEQITSSINSSNPHQDLRDKICALDFNHRHQNILPTKDIIIECVDRCSDRKQLLRCAMLCELLTGRALLEQWENTIACIKNDLERGQKILDFFDSKLSPSDKAAILLSDKLSNHVLGLAEFVRIARHIEATLCDVFCLEISSGSDESLSGYCDLFTSLISINKVWCNISARALDYYILDEIPPLPSIDEIRSRYLKTESSERLELCQLTLQPLFNGNQGTWRVQNFLTFRLTTDETV